MIICIWPLMRRRETGVSNKIIVRSTEKQNHTRELTLMWVKERERESYLEDAISTYEEARCKLCKREKMSFVPIQPSTCQYMSRRLVYQRSIKWLVATLLTAKCSVEFDLICLESQIILILYRSSSAIYTHLDIAASMRASESCSKCCVCYAYTQSRVR